MPTSTRDHQTYRLHPECSLKLLETPVAYRRDTDELYELDDEALRFLNQAQIRSQDDDPVERRTVRHCLRSGLIVPSHGQPGRTFDLDPASAVPAPSLRYLLLHLTRLCNLACQHCYLDPARHVHQPLSDVVSLLDQFAAMHGLLVMLSGGEPLLHPNFWEMNERLPDYDLRFELLTNGTLVTPEIARRLRVQFIQVSLDGLERAHDASRGPGSFRRSLDGITGGQLQRAPGKLSGGEQQRVAIARALANHPELILADEPTGNLDQQTSRTIVDLLRSLAASEQTTVIVVTHNQAIAQHAARIFRIEDGRVRSESS